MNNQETKILFSPCHYVYGDEGSEVSWAYHIADRLAQRHSGSVVVTGRSQASPRSYEVRELQPHKQGLDYSLANAVAFNWAYFRETGRQLRQRRFSIAHHVLPFGNGTTYNLSLLTGRTFGCPFVIGPVQHPLMVRDTDLNAADVRNYRPQPTGVPLLERAAGAARPILRALSRRTLRRAARVIAVDQATAELLTSQGLSEQKIVIIPPGIDTARFRAPSTQQTSVKLGGPSGRPIRLLTVAYLVRRKGIDLILRAVAEVVRQHPNLTLQIIGDGPQRASLEQRTAQLGLAGSVEFAGHIPNAELPARYREADAFVCMSQAEGFATVCLEAMASGLPILSARVGGFNDAVRDGQTGYLVDQGDYRALAKRIGELANEPHRLAEMGKHARRDAEMKYDWESAIIPQYEAVYHAVLTATDNKS